MTYLLCFSQLFCHCIVCLHQVRDTRIGPYTRHNRDVYTERNDDQYKYTRDQKRKSSNGLNLLIRLCHDLEHLFHHPIVANLKNSDRRFQSQ